MRPTPRPLSRGRAALALAVIVVGLATLLCLLWPIHGIAYQALALAGILLALRSCPPVADWIARLPIAHRAAFFLLLGAVILGHFRLNKTASYPFITWGIFSAVSEKDPVFCRQLIGTTEHGRSVRLLVEQLFPSITQFDLPPADQPRQLEDLVQAMARVYNRRHAVDPVRQVDLMLMAVPLESSSREDRPQPSCELLQRYDISSDR